MLGVGRFGGRLFGFPCADCGGRLDDALYIAGLSIGLAPGDGVGLWPFGEAVS
jgi:hypothetical protein